MALLARWGPFLQKLLRTKPEESMTDSSGRFTNLLSLVAFLLLTTVAAVAQLSTASLNGVVRDPTGAVVPNASVTLRNAGTGVERNTVSNETGTYVFSDVNPGRYSLK